MIVSLGRLFKKLAAVVLLVGVGAMAWGFLVRPAADSLRSLSSMLSDEQDKLARYQLAAAELSGDNLRIRNNLALEKRVLFVDGTSYAVKAAHIQAELVRFTRGLGIRLESTHVQPADHAASLELVMVETTFTADIKEIRSLLIALQEARPLLIVRLVQLSPAVERRADGAQMLRARLRVAGVASPKAVQITAATDAR